MPSHRQMLQATCCPAWAYSPHCPRRSGRRRLQSSACSNRVSLSLLHGLVVPAGIHIAGTTLPVKSLQDILQDVTTSIVKHETPEQSLLRLGPNLVPILLTASNVAIPYAGLAVAVV